MADSRFRRPHLLLDMQAFQNYRKMMVGIALAAAFAAGHSWGQVTDHTIAQPTQAQVGSQFLRAILRADYEGAYRCLAPEVRRVVTAARFGAIARPLWKIGQRHTSPLELYKLGVRLGNSGSSRLFYSYSFAADSALSRPSVVLEVTFRDTASRGVLSFGQKSAASPRRK